MLSEQPKNINDSNEKLLLKHPVLLKEFYCLELGVLTIRELIINFELFTELF